MLDKQWESLISKTLLKPKKEGINQLCQLLQQFFACLEMQGCKLIKEKHHLLTWHNHLSGLSRHFSQNPEKLKKYLQTVQGAEF